MRFLQESVTGARIFIDAVILYLSSNGENVNAGCLQEMITQAEIMIFIFVVSFNLRLSLNKI